MNLIRKLAKDNNYKISLLVALGCFTGLRISDILALRWNQILGVSEFTIIEKKTRKHKAFAKTGKASSVACVLRIRSY